MKKKKRRIKTSGLMVIGSFLLIISFIIYQNLKKVDNNEDSKLVKNDFIGMNIEDVKNYCDNQKIELIIDYDYSEIVLKDIVINSTLNDNTLSILVSLGKITKEVYQDKKVDELGRVPIMMYHGIVDQETTEYIGGNVDKDGYNRTANAFRADLEFYYEKGYRMIRLIDYVNGKIDVELGYSPIILTFDDGNKNNFNVLGRNNDGSLIIDPDCAVGILEEFKEKHPDMNVTATFFVMNGLFNQSEYNNEILKWLVEHGYDIGNHTTTHPDFTEISTSKTQEVVGKMYQKLEDILGDKYIKIVALPFGSPYKNTHTNFKYILKGSYNDYSYETIAALRVGWESEVSPFNKNFDKTFLKRIRAYDNNGKEFDIEMSFKNLEKNRYISDGDINKIVIPISKKDNLIKTSDLKIITYEEGI